MSRRKFILVSASIIIILWSIGMYPTYSLYFKYAKSFNRERIALGIPIIEENFTPSENRLWWSGPKEGYPRHSAKELEFRQSGSIRFERDFFKFKKGDTIVSVNSVYRFEEECLSLTYKNEISGVSRKISCKELNTILLANGFTENLKCIDCKSDERALTGKTE
jgi:hypothetical protein